MTGRSADDDMGRPAFAQRPGRRRAAACCLLAAALVLALAACAGDDDATVPPGPSYVFDFAEAERLYAAGVIAENGGDGTRAVAMFPRAVDLKPVYPDAFAAMAATAKRIGDQASLRYATFFAARLDTIAKDGAWLAAQQFAAVARDDPSNRVTDPRIRQAAARLAAFLDAVACEPQRRKDEALLADRMYIQRYGLEAWITIARGWFGDGDNSTCPDVTVR